MITKVWGVEKLLKQRTPAGPEKGLTGVHHWKN